MLAGKRIGERRHQRANTRRGRRLFAPVDRREQHATLLALADHDPQRTLSVIGDDARKVAVGYAEPDGVIGVNLDERFRQMLTEPRADAAAGHGVPLIPDAAGVQPQRPRGRGLGPQRRNRRRDEARRAVVRKELALGKEALLRRRAVAGRPLHRGHHVERLIR